MITRKVVKIDRAKCNGCGDCVPNCAEEAIKIIDGKATLVADNLCDGLGACLGHCPEGAITIEERPAEEFDEKAVHQHVHAASPPASPPRPVAAPQTQQAAGGCPGSRLRILGQSAPVAPRGSAPPADNSSRLGQWPVQLALLPTTGRIWQNADVLIAADCVPFACADFHEKLLAGKSLAIACPKLDDVRPYVQKLAAIFAGNSIKSITVAHMEVPCCTGIVRVVRMALEQASRADIPVTDVTIGINGMIMQ